MSARSLAVVFVASALLVVPAAYGQTSSAAFDQAREQYVHGVALLGQNQFADAAEAFERSIALLERPAAVYNLAVALRGAGQHRRAVTVLGRYLALTGERADDARALLRDSEGRVVHVSLRVTGAPDEVLVDGTPHPATSGDAVDLDPGEHSFEVQRRGYEAVHAVRRFEPGEHADIALDAAAHPLPGVLVVDAGNPSAVLFVDGRAAGRALDPLNVPAGTHVLEVRAPGATPLRRSIDVTPGGRLALSVTLVAQPAARWSIASQWWFWTGLGVVVAGAATGAAVAATAHTETPYAGTWTSTAVQTVRGR